MPPEFVPVFLFLAEEATVVFLCLTVPLPPVLGAMALLGDRPTEPTEVALGAAGIVYTQLLLSQIIQEIMERISFRFNEKRYRFTQTFDAKYIKYLDGVCSNLQTLVINTRMRRIKGHSQLATCDK